MPKLAAALEFNQLEGRNFVAHQLSGAPSTPVKGQLYFNTANNTLFWFDGGGWVAAMGGSGTPTGAAGGDLAGSYPNPTIAPLVIVDGDINAAAAISKSKLAALNIVDADVAVGAAIAKAKLAALNIVDADVAAGAAIAKTKLAALNIVNADVAAGAAIALSKLATDPLARANHTGTQLAATISDFVATRDAQRLDQHAVPTAPVALNGQKITGLADGTVATDAATKGQVDAVIQGLDVKASCRVSASTTVTIASPGANIDGVAMAAGERVLLLAQGGAITTPHAANGIYVWNGAAVPMTRALDADTSAEVTAGLFTFVSEGTNADSGWYLVTNNPIVLGTTALLFVQFSGAGQITDGLGLLKTGNTLDVRVDASSIEINADILRVKALGITNAMLAGAIDATTKLTGAVPVANGGTGQTAQKAARETGLGATGYYSSAVHGAGTTITITQATHALRASRGLQVQVQEEATGVVVLPDVSVAAGGDVTVTFGAAVAANAYRVTVIG